MGSRAALRPRTWKRFGQRSAQVMRPSTVQGGLGRLKLRSATGRPACCRFGLSAMPSAGGTRASSASSLASAGRPRISVWSGSTPARRSPSRDRPVMRSRPSCLADLRRLRRLQRRVSRRRGARMGERPSGPLFAGRCAAWRCCTPAQLTAAGTSSRWRRPGLPPGRARSLAATWAQAASAESAGAARRVSTGRSWLPASGGPSTPTLPGVFRPAGVNSRGRIPRERRWKGNAAQEPR